MEDRRRKTEDGRQKTEVRPKKALGQHFLIDQNIARKIVEQLSPDVESVVEVGAGMGVLTQYMVDDILDKFHVIEIDKESITYLQSHFPSLGPRLVEGDFLKTNLSQYGKQNMAIIGNFPYNISSQIFFSGAETQGSGGGGGRYGAKRDG